MTMHRTRRISARLKRILAAQQPEPQRADLRGLEVTESDFGAWIEAGGERRSKPRLNKRR